ncbi:hypothetical protein AABM38_02305 [Heyndrickxia sp. MSNUG]|uniref:hypothetical protein n=1 Tax=Heyndrickxia sp. MSNUG TaxID=3136677 RepID=UPI003C2E3CA6
MKDQGYLRYCLLSFLLLTSLVLPGKSSATSWAYSFVVWNGYIYVVSDEHVTEVGSEIGHVTKYSDMESYPGNFSNSFAKGTKYYSIKGISKNEAIAVEKSKGQYIKAYREAEYEVRGAFDGYFDGQQGPIKIFVLFIIGILAVIFFYRMKGKKNP